MIGMLRMSSREGLRSYMEFRKLWIGCSISALGSYVTVLALPLTAMLVFGAGPIETGLLLAVQTGAMLVTSLFAGVWVDRLPRRPILIAADLASAVTIGSIPIAALLGQLRLEHLNVTARLAGGLSNVNLLASSALVPALVVRRRFAWFGE
jgi:MFS family permease